MNYIIEYNKNKLNIEIPDDSTIITPKNVITKDQINIINEGLNRPYNSESINDFVKDKNKILIIVNDGTRPTPTSKILEVIYPLIEKKRSYYNCSNRSP